MNLASMPKKNFGGPFFAALFLLMAYLLWQLFLPISGPVIFGSILASAFYPIHRSILEKWSLPHAVAATLTCILIVFLVLVPTIFIIFGLASEGVLLYQKVVATIGEEEINNFLFGEGAIANLIREISQWANFDLDMHSLRSSVLAYVQDFSGTLLKTVNSFASNFLLLLFNLGVMLIVTFSLFLQGSQLKAYLLALSPLPDHQDEMLLDRFVQMNYVTLVGNGLSAILQALIAGIGMWVLGMNSVLLWTVVMMVLAFIPFAGISVVTIPSSIYLLLKGKIISGILFLLITQLASLLIENYFKPRFIGNRIKINSLVVMLSIIGGLGAFNIAGIFYGPLIAILFITIVELYHQCY